MITVSMPTGPPPTYDSVLQQNGGTYGCAEPLSPLSVEGDHHAKEELLDVEIGPLVERLPAETRKASVDITPPKPTSLVNPELKASISETRKHGDSITGYTLYTIVTISTLQEYSAEGPCSALEHVVSRRYSDFDWLRHMLREKYPGCVIPPLPEKTTTTDRFDTIFVEARRAALSKFLQKVTFHKELHLSKDLRLFLAEADPEAWAQRVPWYEKGILGNLSVSMNQWFGHLRITAEGSFNGKGIDSVIAEEDAQYLELVDYFLSLEGRLKKLFDSVQRLLGVHKATGTAWKELGASAQVLGKCETDGANALLNGRGGGLGMTFSQLGASLETLSDPAKEDLKNMILTMSVPLKEYLAEIEAVKETIDDRTNCLLEYMNLKCQVELAEARVKRFSANDKEVQQVEGGVYKTSALIGAEQQLQDAKAACEVGQEKYQRMVERMAIELPAIYAARTTDLNYALYTFIECQGELAASEAKVWDGVLPGVGTALPMRTALLTDAEVQELSETQNIIASTLGYVMGEWQDI